MSIKEIIDWLSVSNRGIHLIAGLILGIICTSWYMAGIVGVTVSAGMEYKDYKYAKEIDYFDLLMLIGGTIVGYGLRVLCGLVF